MENTYSRVHFLKKLINVPSNNVLPAKVVFLLLLMFMISLTNNYFVCFIVIATVFFREIEGLIRCNQVR